MQHREALILLKDVVRHLNSATPDELTPKTYNLMGALIENVVYGAQDRYEFFTKLIPSGEFLVRICISMYMCCMVFETGC